MKKTVLSLAIGAAIIFSGCSKDDTESSSPEYPYVLQGVLDTTFGTDGTVIDNNAAGGDGDDVGNAIAIGNNGKIYVAGRSKSQDGFDMTIWSYETNGSKYSEFGTDGVIHDTDQDGKGLSIETSSDGKIYVAGYVVSANDDMALWSYETNGSANSEFNGGYVSDNNASGGDGDDLGIAIAIGNNGKIYVAGSSTNTLGNDDMALWSYETNGSLNSTFAGGVVTHDNAAGGNGNDLGIAIAIGNNGKIYVAGKSTGKSSSLTSDFDMALWCYETNGSLSTSFGGGDGIVTDNNASGGDDRDEGAAIAIGSDGKIYVAGTSISMAEQGMVVWKYNTDGTLDTSFGQGNGKAFFAPGGSQYTYSMQLDNSGNILVSGYSEDSSVLRAIVVMFDATGNVASSTFGTNGYYEDIHDEPIGIHDSAFNSDKSRLYTTGFKFNDNAQQDMIIWKLK